MAITILKFILLIIGSYFIGNISFARLIAKKQKDDITKHGSGNPGSMNMLRNHGAILGFCTLILDAVKGAVPALVGFFIFGGADGGIMARTALYVAGFVTVIGHDFPVLYKFKGGKGIATTFGLFMVAEPLPTFIMFAICMALFLVLKIGSVSSLLFITAFTVYISVTQFNIEHTTILIIIYIIFLLSFWVHRGNIKKLIKGKENKVDFKDTAKKDKKFIDSLKQKDKTENKAEPTDELNEKLISESEDTLHAVMQPATTATAKTTANITKASKPTVAKPTATEKPTIAKSTANITKVSKPTVAKTVVAKTKQQQSKK